MWAETILPKVVFLIPRASWYGSVAGAIAATPMMSSSGAYREPMPPAQIAPCPPWEWPHTTVRRSRESRPS
jgi:hypothetical protein